MKGSVHYQKSAKRYYSQIYWEGKRYRFWRHPVTGEPFWHKKSAEKQLNKIRTEIDEGYFSPKHWISGNPLYVKTYAIQWLKVINISPNTMRGYKSAANNYIIPFMGDKDIRHIRYNDIVEFHGWIPLTSKGKYNVVNTLKAMMRHAWKSEDLQRVPPFPTLSYQKPEIKYLTLEQQEEVLKHIPACHRPIFQFMMEYGCRPGEARALKWDCVEKDTIIIKRTFSDNRLNEYTKTEEVRYSGITDYIRGILDRLPISLSGFVFVQENGKPYHQNALQQIWQTVCKAAGINIRLYNSTRHSLGCQLLDMGVDMDIVQEQLGHSRADMTKRYAKRSVSVRTEKLNARHGNVVEFKKQDKSH